MLKKLFTPKVNGFIVPNVVAMLIIAGTVLMPNYEQGVLAFSEFVIVPFLIGIMSAWFWRRININGRNLVAYSICNTIIAIALSAIFLREGIICLIIVSPLLIGFIIAGAFAGRAMFKKKNQPLNVSIISLLLAIFIFDTLSVHHYENKVADTMVINAPPAEVWKHVVAFKRIKKQNKFWLFQIGLPSPVESTVEGYYLGAKRKCIFSNGYVFDEKIVTYDENRNLTFDITDQPRDPEIMGHLDLLRGQFLLKDNDDGTTTLTGNSWYRLYVFPVWYYDVWAENITRNVHLRVMEHIKELSETK